MSDIKLTKGAIIYAKLESMEVNDRFDRIAFVNELYNDFDYFINVSFYQIFLREKRKLNETLKEERAFKSVKNEIVRIK